MEHSCYKSNGNPVGNLYSNTVPANKIWKTWNFAAKAPSNGLPKKGNTDKFRHSLLTMTAPTIHKIAVHATPTFIAEQSDTAAERYVFSYTIRITNTGTSVVQLISRHWIITDGNLDVQEVKGAGVIGEQPTIRPGETFEYTSGCQLDTPVGTMRGSYQMVAEDGTAFEAEIPEFTLSIPRVLH